MLTHAELTFLCELCMKEMALLATAKGIKNLDEVSQFQTAKKAGMELWQMIKEKEEKTK